MDEAEKYIYKKTVTFSCNCLSCCGYVLYFVNNYNTLIAYVLVAIESIFEQQLQNLL